MASYEILLPETKPETEWVSGRPLQKVSPQRTHSRLQGALTMRLDRWAAGRGEVGPEWRFRVAPPGEVRRPLVPDVAYVSNRRLRTLSDEEVEIPPLAPDVAVEILSPDDRRADVDDKIGVYLRAGSSLVIVVDPQQTCRRAARPRRNGAHRRNGRDRALGVAGIHVSSARTVRGASPRLILC
jgi:Uma2 family endonuclease